ncbi:MAG: type III-A CRISPR-associated RAMP protein Csm3 [Candidatus Aenigmarchaeota archaeon]|nr:type III-A CRISPR-associated RAMP protein Csm3 [Candidatus Aenigmarchaeota archaeon]
MLKEIVKVNGRIKVVTGLHIGGIKESFKIGGVDNPVIKINGDKEPYIPGSSIKGKIRYLLTKKHESDHKMLELIDKVFGKGLSKKEEEKNNEEMSTRVIFRDAFIENSNQNVFEIKPENTIDKMGVAKPRLVERVVPGTEFNEEIVFNIFDKDNKREIINLVKEGFELLQENYLGGSGSRGYGKVDVSEIIEDLEKKVNK